MSTLENSGSDRNPDAGQDMNRVVSPDMKLDEDETVRMSAGNNGGNRSMKR